MPRSFRRGYIALAHAVMASICWSNATHAQALLDFDGNYSQNFNSLASSGASPWVNNVTLPGWYAEQNDAPISSYQASDGTPPVPGGLISFGPLANGDRAMGNTGPGTFNTGLNPFCPYGVRIRKFPPHKIPMPEIAKVVVTYEQWQIDFANALGVKLEGSLKPSSQNDQNPFDGPDWHEIPGLSFTLVPTGPFGQRDGNLPANQVTMSATLDFNAVFGTPWNDGFDLWFRVIDESAGSTVTHHGGVDDFSFSVVPEPGCLALLAWAASLVWRQRVTVGRDP